MTERRAVLFLFASLMLGSCAGSAPEILFVDRQIAITVPSVDRPTRETLRVFISVRDEDGSQDIAAVLVAHDESELLWRLEPEQWIRVTYGGDEWFGHPRLEHPSARSLPRGRYTVVVEDRSGTSDETDFFLSEPDSGDVPPIPVLRDANGRFTVEARGPVILRGYTVSGELAVTRAVEPGPLPADVVNSLRSAEVRRIYLYGAPDPESPGQRISAPFELPRQQ